MDITRIVERIGRDLGTVVGDLQAKGHDVGDFTELEKDGGNLTKATGVILTWIEETPYIPSKQALLAPLRKVKAKRRQILPVLLSEFIKTPRDEIDYRCQLGDTIELMADDSIEEAIIQLVQQQENGIARKPLTLALGKIKTDRALETLIELLDDDLVCGHAIIGLRKQKKRALHARSKIEPFLNHERAWIRREAKKALATFDKIDSKKKLNED